MNEPIALANLEIRAVILNISRQYEPGLELEQLYERTRGYWVMQPHDHREVEFGIALADGVMREVYRIDAWTRLAVADIQPNPFRRPDPNGPAGRSSFRWIFTGELASEELRKRYIGRELESQGQNPVRWINC